MLSSSRCVLVVEDDNDVREAVVNYLRIDEIKTLSASNLAEARSHLDEHNVGVVILDLMLGHESGFDLLQDAHNANCKVVITSAKGSLDDRLSGYSEGVVNYLVKPYDMQELSAIVQIFLAMENDSASSQANHHGDVCQLGWHYSKSTWVIKAPNQQQVTLTNSERLFIECLLQKVGEPLNRHDIMQALGVSEGLDDYRRLEALVKRLRHKIEVETGMQSPISTARGVGYALLRKIDVSE